MKRVDLMSGEPISSMALFREVIGNAPAGRPFALDEMRKRVRILSALDLLAADATSIDLEDADYDVLKSALETTPYNIASAHVLAIVDAALNAKAPPTPEVSVP